LSIRPAATLIVAALIVSPLAAGAQSTADPDWPCIQRLVPELQAGQMWPGELPEAAPGQWATEATIAPLVPEIAALDLPLADAEARIAATSELLPPGGRDAQLALLFVGALELINGERSRAIEGVKRYARGQRALAEQINLLREEQERLATAEGEQGAARQAELAEQMAWGVRVFEDRMQVLRTVCEQPVRFEQRAFALARAIARHLDGG
jgi:hypothetical protein